MLMDRLIKGIIEMEAPIVVGLDPRVNQIPTEIIEASQMKYSNKVDAAADAILTFNKGLIDALHTLVPAVKPQVAFYEMLGLAGMKAYKETCDYAKEKGMIVVADVKRGDIGSTSKAYADAYIGLTEVEGESFEAFHSDYLTVNPYLGTDCLNEFVTNIDTHDKGMFALVKTSNKSSGELQDLKVDGVTIYEKVAHIIEALSSQRVGKYGYSSIGSVVGATYPEQADTLRAILKTSYFLVPGYGAQGASGKDIVNCFDEKGLGAIVNSSRGITFAYLSDRYSNDYKEAAVQAVEEMKQDINDSLKAAGKWYK
ncbi:MULTISPECIES: orotidine-5'-phosphate decarboxylase [unclassified Fusibacter]|uniref:orotidine-5'-phosphate decarboxylase n=1 Tax=unclassified Fusibacter TaxID=2624464 RepID=UPI001010F38E|nr:MULTISPECIES: orotidine-5'-phosphate decarboxylase [unclassified Fusibacter]MCK8061561.1 orotidine-5'-phosphate decarboxylase [Fusibacter sp. A2]NPE23711.1 orotidine-5'-phosphate decarboxylase [Fusibacter sp. A1]RXV58738.1 orotidine-5'-phosphate decarboxylase [Fusibacter sp. A1]